MKKFLKWFVTENKANLFGLAVIFLLIGGSLYSYIWEYSLVAGYFACFFGLVFLAWVFGSWRYYKRAGLDRS